VEAGAGWYLEAGQEVQTAAANLGKRCKSRASVHSLTSTMDPVKYPPPFRIFPMSILEEAVRLALLLCTADASNTPSTYNFITPVDLTLDAVM
jgi:hypothetical protein